MKGLEKIQNSLFVTGEIGYDFKAEDFIKMLYDDAEVHIYSGGGSLFDALAVYDFIKQSKLKINVFISGLAGSAATIIACASENVQIGANSFYFIHHAFMPYADVTEETQVMLDECNKRIVDIYHAKTGLSRNEIKALLKDGDNGAFLTSAQAKELNFVNTIFKEQSIAAHKPYLLTTNQTQKTMNVEEISASIFNKVKELFEAEKKVVNSDELKKEVSNQLDATVKAMQELTTEKENLELSKKELEEKLATAEKTINDLSTEKETIENSLKEALKGADGGASTEGSPENGKSTTVGNMADETLAGIKNLIKRRKGI